MNYRQVETFENRLFLKDQYLRHFSNAFFSTKIENA